MTNSNTPPEPSNRPNFGSRLWQFIRRPSTLLVIGGTVFVMGTAGYVGVRYFVYQKLSPLIESEISKYLKREVHVGEVESFVFNKVRLGETYIPKTATDADNVSIKAIEVSLNPLPLLVGRPLGIDIFLIDPNIYLDQAKNGQWINLVLETAEKVRELPINLDINVRIEDGDATLKPYALTRPITIKADGRGRYIDTKDRPIEYDFDATVLNSKVNAKGKTILRTGSTQAELLVTQLDLGQLSTLLPNLPITLNRGLFDADLAIDFPSKEKIEETRGTGTLSLNNLSGQVISLKQPLKLDANLDLKGQKLFIDRANFTLGKNQGRAKGEIDWREGYNLDVNLTSLDVPQLLDILKVSFPIDITGLLKADLKVRGLIDKPLIDGKFVNTKTIYFDKIALKEVRSSFQTNLDTLKLRGIQILPTAGGKITSSGDIQLGILYAWKNDRPIKGADMGLNFKVKADLATQKVIAPYLQLPPEIAIGNIIADAEVSGKVGRPQVVLNWQAPTNTVVSKLAVSGKGEIRFVGDNLVLRNTVLKADGGTVNLNGQGNFKTKQWQTFLTANTFPLSPFLPIVCDKIPSTCPYISKVDPLSVERANVRLSGKFDSLWAKSLEGVANAGLKLKNGALGINSQLSNGNIKANTIASGIPLNPFLPDIPNTVQLVRSQVNFTGSLDQILAGKTTTIENWRGNGDVQLLVDNRPFNANAQLNNGIIKGSGFTSGGLSLNPFVPNITLPVSLGQSRVDFSGSLEQLLESKTLDVRTFNANANVQLFVNNNPINTTARLNNGLINAVVNAGRISLNELLPKLPIPAQALETQVRLTGNAQSLLTSLKEKEIDLSSFTAFANSRLAVARGTVNAIAQLNNNQWQSNITANDLNTSFLLTQLTNFKKPLNLANLNATFNLSGNINTLFQPNSLVPVNVNTAAIRLGDQRLNATGNLLISDLTTNPDIANLRLNVNARSNLGRLPFEQLLSYIPIDRSLLPESLNLSGIGQFQGQVTGKNLITAFSQPGNLQLNGNINLNNFNFNGRPFEPLLTGTLKAGIGQNIVLNLRGDRDIIAATLDPCTRSGCIAPYLPVAFELRQTYGNRPPLLAQGRRQGERLIASITRFPLDLLKIAPGERYDIAGYVGGEVNADIDINLFTLAGRGQIRIDEPSIGRLQADAFQANVIYSNGLAQLNNAYLKTGRSQYDIAGSFNFKTGAIQGDLNIAQGYVEDLFAALTISDINSLLRLIQLDRLDKATARQVRPQPVGRPDAPLSQQVNLLAIIEAEIRKIADERAVLGVPTELDIRGQYQANINIAGTLKNPQLNVQLQGKRWEWHPQEPTPDIIDPLGFVITDTQMVPINEVTLQASFKNGVIQIQPARLVIRDSLFLLAGDFSLKQSNAKFEVANLSVDLIQEFVNLPLDLSGDLNTTGTITGSLLNPQVQGQFAFVDGAINARSLDETIAGVYNYTDYRLTLQTTEPDSIEVYASVPYPPIPQQNDRFETTVRLGTEAIDLIDTITQGQIDWIGGNGEVFLQANGRLDLEKGLKLKDFVANGTIVLDNAAIKSAAFPEILTVNGRIDLTPEYLSVQQLQGTIANSQIAVQGVLPFFVPLPASGNPLTVAIQEGEVTLEGLYKGQLDGRVVVTGTAFKPVIGGEVELANGQIYVPDTDTATKGVNSVRQRWIQPLQKQSAPITPTLKDFRVILSRLSVEQEPLYQFDFNGDLALNGSLTNLNNVRPNGVITLNRGRISFLETRFLLNRRHRNVIAFNPDRGLLNPDIDIQMRTIVTELSGSRQANIYRESGAQYSNEIPDNSLNQVQRIDVTLSLKGQLSQLAPGLGQNTSDVCRIHSNELPFPDPSQQGYSQEELERLVTCINRLALVTGEEQQSLLSSSIVRLSSSPPRSQGQIVRLLGDQLFVLVDSLQGKNTEQLVQFGVVQLAIPLVLQSVVYDVESTISDGIGATDFNILPYLEAVYRVDKESFVRFSYDYNFNEVTVKYETRF